MKNKTHYLMFASMTLCAWRKVQPPPEEEKIVEVVIAEKETKEAKNPEDVGGLEEIMISEADVLPEKIGSLDELQKWLQKSSSSLKPEQINFGIVLEYLKVHGKTIFDDEKKKNKFINEIEKKQITRGAGIQQKELTINLVIEHERKKIATNDETASAAAVSGSSQEESDTPTAVFESVSGLAIDYIGSKYKKEKKSHKRDNQRWRCGTVISTILFLVFTFLSGYVGNQMNTCSG